MANDQNEYPLPATLDDQNKRESARHLPRFFRTDQNTKFLAGVLDPLIQPGKLTRINTYIGRKDIPNFSFDDNYETDVSTDRQYYQLEPGFVYTDPVTDEPIWFADYMDYINSLKYYGANTANHAKLNVSETYSWDPRIDWDKFANFKEYYWLPSGPDPVVVYGHQMASVSTFNIDKMSEGDERIDYLFTPNGLTVNPRITLYRGNTYKFNINTLHKPFCIKTEAQTGDSYFYNLGVSKQKVEVGTVTFSVPYEAPDLLYYIDNNDPDSQGIIDIKDIDENTFLDIEAEILGKKTYTTTSGMSFVNGLKLNFVGNVTPEKYSKGLWYVEGVGDKIVLVNYDDIEAALVNNESVDLPFDVDPFDTIPFDNSSNYPEVKDYLTINRASTDRNLWSRNNRWFHIDVLNVTAIANRQIASPDQNSRAIRPIIEFQANIKLFKNGWINKQDVDLVDTTTTDVFSKIEGSLGYFVDGIQLIPGHRVLFTADIDPLVVNKIYKVATITVDTTSIKFLSATSSQTYPYKVTFTFDTLLAPPPINVGYNVEGNSNFNYSGLYNAISSTTSSITLLYPRNPGIFGTGITTGVYDNVGRLPQLTLIPTDDSDPMMGENLYVKYGKSYRGVPFYYDGTSWNVGQEKTKVNQAPLFDLFDENKVSFSDTIVYPKSTFLGNRIFGYKVGTGSNDKELGFPLSYRSIDNIGDIEFEFDLEDQTWSYVDNEELKIENSYQSYVRKYNKDNDTFNFYNGWTTTDAPLWQPAVRILEVIENTDIIPIDIFNESSSIIDIKLQVYVNTIKRKDISRFNKNGVAFIKFETPLVAGDKVVYKVQTVSPKNARGYYQIPHNWQNNPFNEILKTFTLGEAIDHVRTITENLPTFSGSFPGVSNLATLGDVSRYGRRFLQHSGSFPLASYLITDKKNNIIDALQWTSTQYVQFKKEFLRIANTTAFDGTVSERVDQILLEYSKSKYIDRSAFYFSDMAPYKGYTERNYQVVDQRSPTFVIDSIFNPRSQTTRSVLVYVNDKLLTYIIDYTFSETDAFVNIKYKLFKGDIVKIKDYLSTNGSYIPYTPSKLGLFPSYQPKIYLDDTFLNPVNVIQGHDGSITVAYNDFRDNLIIELETRIYNTRRVAYDPSIFNISSVISGYYRERLYGAFFKSEINNILFPDFLRWNSLIGIDYNTNDYYLDDNSFTFNYKNSLAPNGVNSIPGYWRGVYKYMFDTDRPHSHPWEMQGYTIKPIWWDNVYGAPPYTNENKLMWAAIEKGIINTPGNRRTDIRYSRPGLSEFIPVDSDGNLISPLDSNLVKEFSLVNAKGVYSFGDHSPVESAWRRSSEYPFSVIKTACILKGSDYIGKLWDRFTIKRNLVGQIYNSATGKRFNTADIVYPNTPLGDMNDPNVSRYMSSGLSNIIDDYVFSLNAISLDTYKETITGLQTKLSHRMGAFTSKDKLDVLLDSRSPTASGTVFLPKDNFNIFFNLSSPIASIVYSGVLIEKLGAKYPAWQTNKMYFPGNKVLFNDLIFQCLRLHTSSDLFDNDLNSMYWVENKISDSGFRINGYDKKYGTFKIMPAIPSASDPTFNVGGSSESYVEWAANNFYTKGLIVKVAKKYYRAIVANTSSESFDTDFNLKKWAPLASLPITGGVSAIQRMRFSDKVESILYGTVFPDLQSIVDFLLGYQEYLKSVGFSFDNFNKDLGINLDWLTSAKEFMFWSLQNWDSGAIITLSPSSTFLQFNPTTISSVDDFSSSAFEYSILKADGTPFKLNLINVHRVGNGFTVKPTSDSDGIYFIRANLIHREHVLLLDNISNFNDTIYDTVSGYRQGRVKIIGFKTSDWNGGYTTPGFMYDAAIINPWKPFTDYALGDIVSYKNTTYVAIVNVSGTTEFTFQNWKQQEKDVSPGLMANWDYRVEQFRDFYNLNSSIFDENQKKLARHLIGYQDRPYLDNIIIDDVAQFKFYQGFIKEKGTYNSISKLFDVLRSSGFSNINLYEEWAFKVGDYGAIDSYTELEFILDEASIKHNPQDIVFSLNTTYGTTDAALHEIVSSEIAIKPVDYNATPFPTKKIDVDQSDYGIFKYSVAGYVREDDVNHIVYNRAALLNYDISKIQNNDKIWLGYTENNDWDVLEYIKLDLTITTWTVDFVTNSHIYLYCDNVLDIKRGDFISVSNLGTIDGSYIVQTVSNNIVTIYTLDTLATIPNLVTSGIIHKFKSVRYKSLAEVSEKIYNRFNISGEKLWIDSDLTKNWLVLENSDAFSESEIAPSPYAIVSSQQYGYDVKISGNNLFMIVSAPFNERGTVIVYSRSNNVSQWAYSQILHMPEEYLTGTSNDRFGTSIDISYDGQTIIVSAPQASSLFSHYVGEFNNTADYHTDDIVEFEGGLYKSKGNFTGIFDTANWTYIRGYGSDYTGYASQLVNQGAVIVFRYDTNYAFKFVVEEVLLSYHPAENEKFGSKVLLSKDGNDVLLFVSSKDYSYDIFQLDINDDIDSQNILTFDDTSDILVGQRIFGIDDPLTGNPIAVKVVSVDSSTQITVDKFVTLDTGTELTFSLDSIGRVQIFRKVASTGKWEYNTQRFLDYTYTIGDFPEDVFDVSSGMQYGYDIACIPNSNIVAVSAPFLGSGIVYLFQKESEQHTFKLFKVINSETLINGDIENTIGGHLSLGDGFGYKIVISSSILAISAPDNSLKGNHVGAVFNFQADDNPNFDVDSITTVYKLLQVITPPTDSVYERFGTALSLDPKNRMLTIGAVGGPSVLDTTFDSFSEPLSYTDYEARYVLNPASIPVIPTTFDRNATKFYDKVPATGAAYVYNKFDDNYIYADRLYPAGDLTSQDNFGFSIFTSDDCIIAGTPNRSFNGKVLGTVFVFNYTDLSWATLRSPTLLVDINKFKKAFYYNTKTYKIVSNLDLYDPAKGRIPAVAEQEIKYQTYYDPAVYEYRDSSNLLYNSSQIWTDNHVGETWWDLSTFKYTWYEQGNSVYRNTNWGQLFPGSIINVFEWVESKYLPSEYLKLADTTEGLAIGISGIPKDTSDLTYSTKVKYDKISGTVSTLYYFWVSNRKLIPDNSNRTLSSYSLANLIIDPKSQGYSSISITGNNSLSVTNIIKHLSGKDISLNLQFYEIDNTDLQIHREYALIPSGDKDAIIPLRLEKKWFDSLIGQDIAGDLIPDSELNIKQRYGNLSSPQQSWFVNRLEALKQSFEYVNSVLQLYSVADEINLSNLEKQELPPSIISGEIDYIIDTFEELEYIGTTGIRPAKISLVIVDGQVQDWFIDDSGNGYGRNKVFYRDQIGDPVLWYGPKVNISGTGTGAEIETYVDIDGQIVDAQIIKRGQGYDTRTDSSGSDIATVAIVREFTVLVSSDSEARGFWSLHAYQHDSRSWLRVKTQAYNVTKYWSFADWYAQGYGKTSDIKFVVERTTDLNGLPTNIGDLVKVTNIGLGTWLLLLRTGLSNSPDFTDDYQVVGKQDATIQFSPALYNFDNSVGYDRRYSYDLDLYDSTPAFELRIILEALRDDVLVGNLRIEYLNLFFNNIHYILSEQIYTDWFFKTSFLKLNQVVGNLSQKLTFQADPLSDYESYIEEVKPYRTKIREFVSSYQGYDYSYNTVSDFDLPSYYNPETGRLETTQITSNYITQYPWANWLENHTYHLSEIVVTNGGYGYFSRPVVVISPPVPNSIVWRKSIEISTDSYVSFNHNYYLVLEGGITGTTPPIHTKGSLLNGTVNLEYIATDASATAYIATGVLSSVVVDYQGYGYTTSPTITIRGGNGFTEFEQATAYAIIGGSKARSMIVKIKFDRYLKNYYSESFKYTDTYAAKDQRIFKLTYAPELEKTKFTIIVTKDSTVNESYAGIEYYGSQYNVVLTKEMHDTYDALIGTVTFNEPVSGLVSITYYKNISIYGAADRINYAYNQSERRAGKDLSQLMTGIDYGGVEFTSIGFNIAGGWDVLPWDVSSWDTIVDINDDYVFLCSNDTIRHSGSHPAQFTLPYVPNNGDIINVYLTPFGTTKSYKIDDVNYENKINIYGNPVFSALGALDNTSSIGFNTIKYIVSRSSLDPVYNSTLDLTYVYISIFTRSKAMGIYQYPKPLTKWTVNSINITNDAIRYDYTTWRVQLAGDQTDLLGSSVEIAPPEDDYISVDQTHPLDFSFGKGDFTIEMFVKPSKLPDMLMPDISILTVGESAGKQISIRYNTGGYGLGFVIPNNSNNADVSNVAYSNFIVNGVISRTGNNPCLVKFDIPLQTDVPVIGISYAVEGNTNTKYNGIFQAVASTTSSITLSYPRNPGVYGTQITGNTTMAAQLSLTKWSHIALSKKGNSIYFFVNGVLQQTATNINFNFAAITTVSSTAHTAPNYPITCASTSALAVDMPILFSASNGGLLLGTIYYVRRIINSTSFSVSLTIGGPTVVLSNSTAIMNVYPIEPIPLYIGRGANIHDGLFNGSVSNVRILKGRAIYTVNFAVPNTALPNINNTVFLTLNSSIVTKSFVGDGINNVVDVSTIGYLVPGDQLTFRKSTSDGTILPNDQLLLDSVVSGGDLGYTSAKGIAPEDIIVDGDKFITPDTGFGPEELLQGQVTDAVDIKVYSAPTSGGPRFVVNNYVGDGVTYNYKLGTLPSNDESVTLNVGNKLVMTKKINYSDQTIDILDQNGLPNPPAAGKKVTTMIIDTSGYDILSKEIFVGDNMTTDFPTVARFSGGNVSTYITVDGNDAPDAYIRPDDNEYAPNVVIVFPIAPAADSIIQVMVFRGVIQKYSKATTQLIPILSEKKRYHIERLPKNITPVSAYVWVILTSGNRQEFLRAPDYENFVYPVGTGNTERQIPLNSIRYKPRTLGLDLIRVYKNKIQLRQIRDYTFDVVNNIITLNKNVATTGDSIIVEILLKNDFEIIGDELVITDNFNLVNKDSIINVTATSKTGNSVTCASTTSLYIDMPILFTDDLGNLSSGTIYYVKGISSPTKFTVSTKINGTVVAQIDSTGSIKMQPAITLQLTVFSNHDMFDIRRISEEFTFTNGYEANPFDVVQYDISGTAINTSGILNLPRTVSDRSVVLVAVSRRLLVPQIDYVVLDNNKQIQVLLPDILDKSDYVEVITTNPQVNQASFGFKIFKDMLNRTQYKRLNDEKSTMLSTELKYYDTKIEVENASMLDDPNKRRNLPGVITINSERIEYMVKQGNILSQLRRGTLGTAVVDTAPVGTKVMNLGYSETIPYQDTENKNTYIADTASDKNLGILFGTYDSTIYGVQMIGSDHNVSSVITINQVDIPVSLIDVHTRGWLPTNRNTIKNAINLYTNITGIKADRVIDSNHPLNNLNPNGIDLIPVDTTIGLLSVLSKGRSENGYNVTFAIPPQILPPIPQLSYEVKGNLNTTYNGNYFITNSTTTSVTLEYPDNPGEFTNKITIISFVSKVGIGPYNVTFTIPTLSYSPTLDISYTISGNFNIRYNGTFKAIGSTKNTITLSYPYDPGIYKTNIPSVSYASKSGTGPYLVTYNIPDQSITVIVNEITAYGGENKLTVSNPTGISAGMKIIGLAGSPYTITSVRDNILTLDRPRVDFVQNLQVSIIDPPAVGASYNVSGVNDAANPLVGKAHSYYNGSFVAVSSTSHSITLRYPTDPLLFGGAVSISLSKTTQIASATSLIKTMPETITVSSSYILPIDFVPRVNQSTVEDGNTWFRETIPNEYGQNDEMEVFLSGRRLNKTPITVYDQTLGQDSYDGAGDRMIEADYSVNGVDPAIRFTKTPDPGAIITIITRKGRRWGPAGEVGTMAIGRSDFAKFVTSVSVALPK